LAQGKNLNWHFLLGVGFGLVLAALVMLVHGEKSISPAEVERLARQMGMVYMEEITSGITVE
jgi:hypothetical protein